MLPRNAKQANNEQGSFLFGHPNKGSLPPSSAGGWTGRTGLAGTIGRYIEGVATPYTEGPMYIRSVELLTFD